MKYRLPPGVTKTYLSRSMTRALSMHEPIGDPFGGPAYGERNDPVSAALSLTAMAGSYAAAGSFAAMTLAQGMIFAGGALSLAGNVTGNKSLMKVGAVIGLIGGIGSVMDVGSFNEQVFTSSAEKVGTETVSSALNTTPQVAPQVDVSAPLTTEVTVPNTTSNPALSMGANNVTANVNTPGSFGTGATNPSLNVTPANLQSASPSTLSKIVDFADKHPGAALLTAQAVGSTVGPIANAITGADDAQIAQLKADADYRRALADKAQADLDEQTRRRDQLRANQSAIGTLAVNPSAVTVNQPGLINLARST
jgi:hypothetical protein